MGKTHTSQLLGLGTTRAGTTHIDPMMLNPEHGCLDRFQLCLLVTAVQFHPLVRDEEQMTEIPDPMDIHHRHERGSGILAEPRPDDFTRETRYQFLSQDA